MCAVNIFSFTISCNTTNLSCISCKFSATLHWSRLLLPCLFKCWWESYLCSPCSIIHLWPKVLKFTRQSSHLQLLSSAKDRLQWGGTWKHHRLEPTRARSRFYVSTPPTSYVRATLYRVVGIIHVAASGRDKVVILRPSDTFPYLYMFWFQRSPLCVLDWSSFSLRATEDRPTPRSDSTFPWIEGEFGPRGDW